MNEMITLRDRMADFMTNQQCINGFYIQSMVAQEQETDEFRYQLELFFVGFSLLITLPQPRPEPIFSPFYGYTFFITAKVSGIDGLYIGKVAFLANQAAQSIREVHLRSVLDKVFVFPPIQV